jgi:hypothetical protein
MEKWFDELWRQSENNVVNKDVLARVRADRRNRDDLGGLEAFTRKWDNFRGKPIRIIVYHDTNDGADLEVLARISRPYTVPYYNATGWKVEEGTVFLDFNLEPNTKSAKFQGTWKIADKNDWHTTNNRTSIMPSEKLVSLDGVKCSAFGKPAFINLIVDHLEKTHTVARKHTRKSLPSS